MWGNAYIFLWKSTIHVGYPAHFIIVWFIINLSYSLNMTIILIIIPYKFTLMFSIWYHQWCILMPSSSLLLSISIFIWIIIFPFTPSPLPPTLPLLSRRHRVNIYLSAVGNRHERHQCKHNDWNQSDGRILAKQQLRFGLQMVMNWIWGSPNVTIGFPTTNAANS